MAMDMLADLNKEYLREVSFDHPAAVAASSINNCSHF